MATAANSCRVATLCDLDRCEKETVHFQKTATIAQGASVPPHVFFEKLGISTLSPAHILNNKISLWSKSLSCLMGQGLLTTGCRKQTWSLDGWTLLLYPAIQGWYSSIQGPGLLTTACRKQTLGLRLSNHVSPAAGDCPLMMARCGLLPIAPSTVRIWFCNFDKRAIFFNTSTYHPWCDLCYCCPENNPYD